MRYKSNTVGQLYRSASSRNSFPEQNLWMSVIKLTFSDLELMVRRSNFNKKPNYVCLEEILALIKVIENKWFGDICDNCKFAHYRAIAYANKYVRETCRWPLLDKTWMREARWGISKPVI